MKNRFIITLLAVVLVLSALFISGCTGSTVGDDTEADDATSKADSSSSTVKKAEKLIADGDIEGAYSLLSGLKNNKKAEEMLESFRYVIKKAVSANYEYTVGYGDGYRSAEAICDGKYRICIEINEKGALKKEIFETVGYSLSELTMNDDGNVIAAKYTYSNGEQANYEYQYNERGDQIYRKYVSGDNAVTEVNTEYGYSSDGHIMWKLIFPSEKRDDAEIYLYMFDGENNTKVISKKTSGALYEEKNEFDEKGNVVKIEKLKNGDITNTVGYTYDAAGNIIRIENKGTSYLYITTYTYDDRGNMLSFEADYGNNNVYKVEFEYEMVYSETELSDLTSVLAELIID